MKQLGVMLAVILSLTAPLALVGCGGGNGGGAGGYSATTAPPAQNRAVQFAQRHKTATSLGAGYAAYKAAKVTGQHREMAGGHKNFAQRHPFVTGVAAAAVTHHMISKSQHQQ
jgi:hypothetical protein